MIYYLRQKSKRQLVLKTLTCSDGNLTLWLGKFPHSLQPLGHSIGISSRCSLGSHCLQRPNCGPYGYCRVSVNEWYHGDGCPNLGANYFKSWPSGLAESIASGIMAGFFIATYSGWLCSHLLLGRDGFSNLISKIYSRARRGISLEINAISTLMFIMSLILVIGYYFIKQGNNADSTVWLRPRREAAVVRTQGILAILAISTVLFGIRLSSWNMQEAIPVTRSL